MVCSTLTLPILVLYSRHRLLCCRVAHFVRLRQFARSVLLWFSGTDVVSTAECSLTPQADVVIVGGGVIGIATAYHLATLRPDLIIVLLENGGLGANTGR